MPYKLECAQSFSSNDASEADVNRAFDDDRIRGEYIILTAPDGSFIQAAGEFEGPYVLEYCDAGAPEFPSRGGTRQGAGARCIP